MSVVDQTFPPTVASPPASRVPRKDPGCAHAFQATDQHVDIPSHVVDLDSFREWRRSEELPEKSRISFLNGVILVDLSMEELLTHSRLKARFYKILGDIVDKENLGYLFPDGVLLTNPSANLSTEPDCTFCLWETVRSERVRFVPGKKSGYVELEGMPDFVLEIVSSTSVKKDTVTLPPLYWQAGIGEFWLVDAREAPVRFTIFCHGVQGYAAQPTTDKGVFSPLFARHFRIVQEVDPLGHPSFQLALE